VLDVEEGVALNDNRRALSILLDTQNSLFSTPFLSSTHTHIYPHVIGSPLVVLPQGNTMVSSVILSLLCFILLSHFVQLLMLSLMLSLLYSPLLPFSLSLFISLLLSDSFLFVSYIVVEGSFSTSPKWSCG